MGAVSGSETVTINAPLDQVLAVIRNIPGQVDWFPGCVSAEVVSADADGLPARARQVNDVKVAKDEFEVDHNNKFNNYDDYSIVYSEIEL